MRPLARVLRARPRLLLGLLLAFAIETLRPAVAPVAHRHPGGDHRHAHLGAVLPGAHALSPARDSERGHPAFGAAAPPGLHLHLLRAVEPAGVPAVAAVAPRLAAAEPPALAPSSPIPIARRASRARAPPAIPA